MNMGYFFRCPREFFKSDLLESEKPVSPAVALLAVMAQVAFGCYTIQGADGTELQIRPGQFAVDVTRLEDLTGWSETELNRFLYYLRDHQVLGRRVLSGVTIATLHPEAVADLPPFPKKPSRVVSKADAVLSRARESLGER
jgi:hypothetical protein